MTTVTEIAPDVYRISTYESQFKLQFNQFLVKGKEPLLFHTGMKGMFPVVPGGCHTQRPAALAGYAADGRPQESLWPAVVEQGALHLPIIRRG